MLAHAYVLALERAVIATLTAITLVLVGAQLRHLVAWWLAPKWRVRR